MNKAANDMKTAIKTQMKSGYLNWIESLNESDLQEFNTIELQGQIVTTINLINRLESK